MSNYWNSNHRPPPLGVARTRASDLRTHVRPTLETEEEKQGYSK